MRKKRRTLPGFRVCRQCGHIYATHRMWCGNCFDEAGQPRTAAPAPNLLTDPALGNVAVGDRVRSAWSGESGTVTHVAYDTFAWVKVDGHAQPDLFPLGALRPAAQEGQP